VRTIVGLGLTAVCLALAGCLGSGGKGPSLPEGSKPFQPRSTDGEKAPSGVDGMLAGQVMDKFKRRLPDVYIQVVDLQDLSTPPKARLDVPADKDGYFTIQGLKPGRTYQLIARVKEGDKTLSGTALATPPNPRLSIYLSEDFTTPSTPAPPEPPAAPERKTEAPRNPAATLEPPSRSGDGAVSAPGPSSPINKTRIADDVNYDFDKLPQNQARIPRPDATAIPGPVEGPKVLPPPPGTTLAPPAKPRGDAAPASPAAAVSGAAAKVPSIVLVGDQLHSLALRDLKGQTWEYSRDRSGKLVLLIFWRSDDNDSLAWIPALRKMQTDLAPSGLEVVWVAYQQAVLDEEATTVRAAKGRYGMKDCRLLLGGGAPETCPVAKEFMIDRFPTLILLDDKGKVTWRSRDALDARQMREMQFEITRRTGKVE
jgi:hypothetical protein